MGLIHSNVYKHFAAILQPRNYTDLATLEYRLMLNTRVDNCTTYYMDNSTRFTSFFILFSVSKCGVGRIRQKLNEVEKNTRHRFLARKI